MIWFPSWEAPKLDPEPHPQNMPKRNQFGQLLRCIGTTPGVPDVAWKWYTWAFSRQCQAVPTMHLNYQKVTWKHQGHALITSCSRDGADATQKDRNLSLNKASSGVLRGEAWGVTAKAHEPELTKVWPEPWLGFESAPISNCVCVLYYTHTYTTFFIWLGTLLFRIPNYRG